jgi:hypothetical protein
VLLVNTERMRGDLLLLVNTERLCGRLLLFWLAGTDWPPHWLPDDAAWFSSDCFLWDSKHVGGVLLVFWLAVTHQSAAALCSSKLLLRVWEVCSCCLVGRYALVVPLVAQWI